MAEKQHPLLNDSETPKRVCIYGRVSTEKQDAENQFAELRDFADRQGWAVVETIADVCSGSKSANEREGLQKVFDMARQRKIDIVLFWSLDRFSREGSRKTLEYLTRLDSYGTKWHSYRENFISSMGIFADAIISIMAALAKQERIRISERTKAGLERVKRGGKQLGRPITIDAKKIKKLREQGLSMAKIAKECAISKTRVFQILQA